MPYNERRPRAGFVHARTAGDYVDQSSPRPVREATKGEAILRDMVQELEPVSETPGADEKKFEGPDKVLVEGENFRLERYGGEMVVKSVMPPTEGNL